MPDAKTHVVEVSVMSTLESEQKYYLELHSRALIFFLDVLQFLSVTDVSSKYPDPTLDKKTELDYTTVQNEDSAQQSADVL